MLIDILNEMLSDLNSHKRDKHELMEMYVNERLSQSLETYYNQLTSSIEYLSRKNNITVMRRLNK